MCISINKETWQLLTIFLEMYLTIVDVSLVNVKNTEKDEG